MTVTRLYYFKTCKGNIEKILSKDFTELELLQAFVKKHSYKVKSICVKELT